MLVFNLWILNKDEIFIWKNSYKIQVTYKQKSFFFKFHHMRIIKCYQAVKPGFITRSINLKNTSQEIYKYVRRKRAQ